MTRTKTAPKITPSTHATNPVLGAFFGNCCDDTRRKILRHIGMPERRSHPWGEIWAALGIAPEQPETLWEHLTIGSTANNVLWDAARVAEEVGLASSTVNDYCKNEKFPDDFPKPLINVSKKTRLWLPLEVRAYVRPSLYRKAAEMIRREPNSRPNLEKAQRVSYIGTMRPLPPPEQTD